MGRSIYRDKKSFQRLVYFLIAALLLFFLAKAFSESLFFRQKDRINFVIYDETPALYSVSTTSSINYAITFDHDERIKVPGGYGQYRVGALGKLVNLGEDDKILGKALASATSAFVDFYFYANKPDIYYKNDKTLILAPGLYKILLYRSNANIFDRIYLFMKFTGKSKGNFTRIPYNGEGDFLKKYQGYFYQKTYRKENKTVQLLYSKNYYSATTVSQVLEGNGIRVADLSEKKNITEKTCKVVEKGKTSSKTARDISAYFGCTSGVGETGAFDIIIILGKVEGEWE